MISPGTTVIEQWKNFSFDAALPSGPYALPSSLGLRPRWPAEPEHSVFGFGKTGGKVS